MSDKKIARWVVSMLAAIIAITPTVASAAKIFVSVTAPDPVGKRLAYELREKISSSSRDALVMDEDEAAFKILIVTMDKDKEDISTIYSVVLNLRDFSAENSLDFFITSWVGVCGRDRVISCAANLASEVDSQIQPIVQLFLKKSKESKVIPDDNAEEEAYKT